MELENKGLLFSHIPKTAGTSLRLSVQRHVKGWKVYADYEVDNPTTTRVIRKCYESGDFSIVNDINGPKTLLAGHFPISKYLPYYPLHRVISFVRDPVQRVISHYHDLQRRHGYSETLETFIQAKKFQNTQSRFFRGIPIEAVGFIGVCEFYDESIELLNNIYSIAVPVKKYNINKKKNDDFYIASGEISKLIKEANEKDSELYETALKLFLKRKELIKSKKPYVYGKIEKIDSENIEGWAVDPKSSESVKLNLMINEKLEARLVADQTLENLDVINIARNGKVGFKVKLNKIDPDIDKIMLYVDGTNQQIE